MPSRRIAFGSCSHPALPQPLWKIINSRHPAAFIWGGDAVYSDVYAGLNWTAVGVQRVHASDTHNSSSSSNSWRLTFPPPSIHVDATPDIIHGWYEKQYNVVDYRQFVQGWYDDYANGISIAQTQLTRPIIFGTVDDHDYGQNNGDYTFICIIILADDKMVMSNAERQRNLKGQEHTFVPECDPGAA